MRFIDAQNEEELNMLATKTPELKKAVGVLKELSADERTRMLAEDREKARRDMASRLDGAREEGERKGREEGREEGLAKGKLEVAQKLKAMGLSPEQIATATGLSLDEIESTE